MDSPSAFTTELPGVLPVFPLDGALLLPRGQLPLNIFEPRYLNMIDDAMASERIIGMVQTKAGGERSRPKLADVGCAGRITSFAETPDGRYVITLVGVCRFRLGPELSAPSPYRQVRADFTPFEVDLTPGDVDEPFDRAALATVLKAYLNRRGLDVDWSAAESAPFEALINSLSAALPLSAAEKQALLEARDLPDRAEMLATLLAIGSAEDEGDGAPSLQ